jgi:hypothetical protein
MNVDVNLKYLMNTNVIYINSIIHFIFIFGCLKLTSSRITQGDLIINAFFIHPHLCQTLIEF